MNEQLISWIIILEVALPFIVLSLVLTWILISSKKKNKAAVRSLILRIKNNEQSQRERLNEFLTNKLGIEETAAKKSCKKIINERKFLFRNLISVLLDKNMGALVELEDDLSRITSHYHQLNVELKEIEEEPEEEETEDVEALKQEIKTLKHEVHITLTTLNNIFAEFSSMFGEEVPDTEMSVDQIITAMESFSGKAPTDSTEEEDSDFEDLDEPDAFAETEDSGIEETEDLDIETEEIVTEQPEMPDTDMNDVSMEDDGLEAIEEIDEESDNLVSSDEDASSDEEESLDFSIDSELDDIDSALDELELGASSDDDEPSWDDAFAESGDKKPDEN